MELEKQSDKAWKQSFIERAAWENAQAQPGQHLVVESNWVQLTSPFAPTPFMNGVLRCEVSEADIDLRIRQTVEHYRAKGLPFRWKVLPSSRPADLRSRLERNGLVLKDRLFGFFADSHLLEIKSDPAIRVERVSVSNLEDWLSVQAMAWNVPPQGISFQRGSMKGSLKISEVGSANSKSEDYIAYFDGKPVGSAGMCVTKDYVLLAGGAVTEEMRGRGVYRALVAHRMQRIRDLGLPAVIHCLEKTSAPIISKLGFEKICKIDSFESNFGNV